MYLRNFVWNFEIQMQTNCSVLKGIRAFEIKQPYFESCCPNWHNETCYIAASRHHLVSARESSQPPSNACAVSALQDYEYVHYPCLVEESETQPIKPMGRSSWIEVAFLGSCASYCSCNNAAKTIKVTLHHCHASRCQANNDNTQPLFWLRINLEKNKIYTFR